ncbi:MAG: Rieske 2Fe-2S domain-containing protein [Gemmatimonadota bacterium]|nr:Rieske 2Fe-2S domain-containing protein [Gemmatimonadota bacterium]
MSDHNTDSERSEPNDPDVPARRNFIARLGAIVAGGLASLVPIAAGAAALLDPLRRGGGDRAMVRVTRVSALPADGTPRKFTVEADRTDAWSTYADTPVGAVYLRRTEDGVVALNVVCPHAGCFVRLADDRSRFQCPCHNSRFDLNGDIDDPSSPSPRSMDALAVEVRDGDEVWVRFQHFLPGREEKIPV